MTSRPTPARWPGSIRLGQQTYIETSTNALPVTTLVMGPPPEDYEGLLSSEYDEYEQQSYASLSREYYTGALDEQ